LSGHAYAGKQYAISFEGIDLKKGERVESVKLEVRSGFLCAIKAIPDGWEVKLTYEGNGLWLLMAGAVWGSARVDLNSLDNLIIVRKDPNSGTGLLPPFVVECTLYVVSDVKEEERTIKLSHQQLKLKEVK